MKLREERLTIDAERGIVATITASNVHIENSYLVGKADIQDVLTTIQGADALGSSVFEERNKASLKAEWVVHNALYNLGIQRERTKDVDLDYPCDKPEWVYKTLSVVLGAFCK